MEFDEQLERIRDLIEDGKPKTALKQLKAIYDPDNPDLRVMLEIANGMGALKQWGKARAMLGKAIELFPEESVLWTDLSYFYQAEEDYARALEAIEIGLMRHPDEMVLWVEKSQLLANLGKRDGMHELIDDLLGRYPNDKVELLKQRSAIYESLSYTPDPDEQTVSNGLGMTLAIQPLTKAIDDLDLVLEEVKDWHTFMKRAKLNKDLQQFDAAIVDYDSALQLLDEEGEFAREFIEQEREGCLNGGLGERSQIAALLKEGMERVDDIGELSQEQMTTNNVIEAMADRFAEGEDIGDLLDELGDDPDQLVAIDVAQEILKQAREPHADFAPTDSSEFAKSAQKYCDRVEKVMLENDFKSMGDFEPRGLSQHLGNRFLVRIFLSSDQTMSAVAFEVKPLKPGFLLWLLMVILRKWKSVRVTELVTEMLDGHFIVTNNSGDLNPFTLEGDVDFIALPLKTSIDETIASHIDRIQHFDKDQLIQIDGTDKLFEQQERFRQLKNAYRQSIGFVTDEELKKLLGKQYDKYAEDVRKYLKRLARALN